MMRGERKVSSRIIHFVRGESIGSLKELSFVEIGSSSYCIFFLWFSEIIHSSLSIIAMFSSIYCLCNLGLHQKQTCTFWNFEIPILIFPFLWSCSKIGIWKFEDKTSQTTICSWRVEWNTSYWVLGFGYSSLS